MVKSTTQASVYKSSSGGFSLALEDLGRGISQTQQWRALAADEFVRRYKDTALGFLWSIGSFALFAAGLRFVVIELLGSDRADMAAYALIGFLIFQFLLQTINEAPNIFVSAQNWLKNARVPISLFVFKNVWLNGMTFGGNAIGCAIVLALLTSYRPSWDALLCLPAILVIIMNTAWVYIFIGVICSRIRDLGILINTAMRAAFFITPIMWHVEERGPTAHMIAMVNPLYHYMEIFRAPLMGAEFPVLSWLVVLGLTIVGWLAAITVMSLFKKQLIFWL